MKKDILKLLSLNIRKILSEIDDKGLCEIRLRGNLPIVLRFADKNYFIDSTGITSKYNENCYICSIEDIKESMEYITNYSIYAFNDELKKGFITVKGGHRIGVCGKTIYENGIINTIRNIQGLNIRIAHEIFGVAENIADYLKINDNFVNTLIVSRPGMGKTTLLRDLIRLISLSGKNISVVDERSEIAASYLGISQNNLGFTTDVMDCCQKYDGIIMMLRSMNPDFIAVDEIGSVNESDALLECANSGCSILATVHANDIGELCKKKMINSLLENDVFKRFVVCSKNNDNYIKHIYDEKFNEIKGGII